MGVSHSYFQQRGESDQCSTKDSNMWWEIGVLNLRRLGDLDSLLS